MRIIYRNNNQALELILEAVNKTHRTSSAAQSRLAPLVLTSWTLKPIQLVDKEEGSLFKNYKQTRLLEEKLQSFPSE